MRIETIDELAEVLGQSQLTSLELESDKWSVTLERASAGVMPPAPAETPASAAEPAPAPSARPGKGDTIVEAAIVGVFHEAAPPFTIGKSVRAGDILGTIDALTIRNEVRASGDGEIVALHVEDGQPVEYGQPLFAIRLHGGLL